MVFLFRPTEVAPFPKSLLHSLCPECAEALVVSKMNEVPKHCADLTVSSPEPVVQDECGCLNHLACALSENKPDLPVCPRISSHQDVTDNSSTRVGFHLKSVVLSGLAYEVRKKGELFDVGGVAQHRHHCGS